MYEAVLEQTRALLENAYVHLPAHQAAGVDPLAHLEMLRRRPPTNQPRLYRQLLRLFALLGDRHTHCTLPEPLASQVAYLPFRVGEFFAQGRRHLAVLSSATEELARGDILLSWNGRPLMDIIRFHQAWQHGANPEARHAKAVQTLTLRPLALLPPPRSGVTLQCLSATGRERTVRLRWRVANFTELANYFPPPPDAPARVVETSHGTFGLIRVDTLHGHPEEWVAGFLRRLEPMPRQGLILDLRNCEEGIVQVGERLLQLFTPRRIQPQPFQFRVTELIRRIVHSSAALSAWHEPVERAARLGQVYSQGVPLTREEEANALGQRYHGPVVLLVSALTYSTAEMVAAGFQDHQIGRVLGTAPCTGGGGASPWPQSTLFKLSHREELRPLPEAPTFRVAVRRCLRVHDMSGVPLEGGGVLADDLHRPTKNDLFNSDVDLLERAGELLAGMR